jgi:SAM-dependent methyltransferase
VIPAGGGAKMAGMEQPPPDPYGEDLRPGDPHYRAYVGPPWQYDVMGAIQFGLLIAAGMREVHRVADLGCGSLRAGRLLIPFLRPGHYFGVEPNRWLVDAGIERELGSSVIDVKRPTFSETTTFDLVSFGVEFDYVLAQSVFSHTHDDLTLTGFHGVRASLADGGLLLATFKEGEPGEPGSGWVYPETVPTSWKAIRSLLGQADLVGERIDWAHPRQVWFVAAKPDDAERVATVAAAVHPPGAVE